MKIEVFKAAENLKIEDVEKVLKQKLGEKYELKLKKASGIGGQMIGGVANDQVTVIKNAYHRTVVSLMVGDDTDMSGKKATFIYFSEAELATWLRMLRKEGGLIGWGIIRLIYGGSDEIYDAVKNTIKENIDVIVETHEHGLRTMFKKNKKVE